MLVKRKERRIKNKKYIPLTSFTVKKDCKISEHQTRFTHIVNHLLGLAETFEDEGMNIKNPKLSYKNLRTDDYNNQGI